MQKSKALEIIQNSPEFRVLRSIHEQSEWSLSKTKNEDTRKGIFIDIETTGLDHSIDKIIEICIIPFYYDRKIGEIQDIQFDQIYQSYNDPKIAIPNEASKIHGIFDRDVLGKKIDLDLVQNLIFDASIIIAHNSRFDRKFLENYFSIFSTKNWACSLTDIDWSQFGFSAKNLEFLIYKFGYFFVGHRAYNDCLAGIFLLHLNSYITNRQIFFELFQNSKRPQYLFAINLSYDEEKNKILRKGGFKFNRDDKSWRKLSLDKDNEMTWLKKNFQINQLSIKTKEITAMDRFSERESYFDD